MKQKYSVLIIDDQDNWRKFLIEFLESQFEVTNARSYDDALEIIRRQKPPFHVVVTDMRLVDKEPGNQDGLKLIEALNHRGDESKTIIVTGYPTIATAKQALSSLQAHDYLEKVPSDGTPFNIKSLQQIVYQAAQEAEAKRPHGFTDGSQDILLLEPDPEKREKLKNSLTKDGYQVHIPEINKNLERDLKNNSLKYSLILLNETLANENLLANLLNWYPDTRMVMLTSHDVDNIFKVMRKYPVLTAFNINEGNFNQNEFQEFIHSALAHGAIRYVSTQIEIDGQTVLINSKKPNIYTMELANTYHVTLTIQDTPTEGAKAIWLSPREAKRGKIQLHLFIYAKEMNLEPSTEMYWKIPLSNEVPRPIKFSITPHKLGEGTLAIDIDQNHRFLGRISLGIDVK